MFDRLFSWISGKEKTPPKRRLVPLVEDPRHTKVELLCDAYVFEPADFADLAKASAEVEALHPGMRALSTLDDINQAFYTNAHTIQTYDFDQTDGHDLSSLPQEVFEDGEHLGYFTRAEEFPLRRKNFERGMVSAARSLKKLHWIETNTEDSLTEINTNPDLAIDPVAFIQAVPVRRSSELVAAFPNGYFAQDLSPFEIADLAERLEVVGAHLWAIGASYLAFRLDKGMHRDAIGPILSDVYIDADLLGFFNALGGQEHMILRYTE